MDLNRLKKLAGQSSLAEDQSKADLAAGRKKVFKIMDPLHGEAEKAGDAIEKIRSTLQSSVLTDLLKAEGFPATESKAAKDAIEAAYKAMRKAENEIADLHLALGMHFEEPLDD